MESTDASTRTVRCVVVTPERAVLDQTADFVAVPMFDGELGVLPGRAPLIGRLGYGELRIQQREQVRRYYVDGGFVQARADVVTVLTSRAIPAEELKVGAAEDALRAAQKITTSPEEQESQSRAQQRARAQIRLAQKITASH